MEEGRLMKMTKTRIFPINENLTVMVPVTFHILAAATGRYHNLPPNFR